MGIIEEAIKTLKRALCSSNDTTIPKQIVFNVIKLLESEPKQGEFTKNFRKLLRQSISDFTDGDAVDDDGARIAKALLIGEEACDRIDHLEASCKLFEVMVEQLQAELKDNDAEIKNLKKAVAGTIDHISMILDNYGLQATYKELAVRLKNERDILEQALKGKPDVTG